MTNVTLIVPNESTVIEVAGNAYAVTIDAAGLRTVTLPADAARVLTGSGLPCALPWIESNRAVAASLGPMPKVEPGLHIASYLQVIEGTRPRSPLDRGGVLNDTLRELGRLR
jgi:hypothetical protein